MKYDLIFGDCLDEMKNLPDNSVDLILCDLPYGTTKCKWDVIIPFVSLWEQYKRVIKANGAILLFGSEPFSSSLRLSNIEWYQYDLYWVKEKPTNFMMVKKRAGKLTENICVFYENQPTYNPQMIKYDGPLRTNKPKDGKVFDSIVSAQSKTKIKPYTDTGYRYPCDVLNFRRVILGKTIHPTEKPVPLLEYLIKTYSNEGDTVLDNCMGSGSCGEACINTNRNFIGIEKDNDYFLKAKQRIDDIYNQNLFEIK